MDSSSIGGSNSQSKIITMYLAYLGHSTQTKNKLEEAFYAFLRDYNRTVIQDENIHETKKMILDKYDDLCKEHSKCKPLSKSWSKCYNNSGDFILYGANVSYYLLKSK